MLPQDARNVYDELERSNLSLELCSENPVFINLLQTLSFASLQELASFLKQNNLNGLVVPLYTAWINVNNGTSPHIFAAWFNAGLELSNSGDVENAITSYRNALILKADCYQAAVNLGLQHESRNEIDLALNIWSQALQPDDARTMILNHRGRVLENLRRFDEAEASLFASLLTTPRQPDVIHHWVYLRQKMCAWPALGPEIPGLSKDELIRYMGPLSLLALSDDREIQDRFVEGWLERKAPPPGPRLSPEHGYAGNRIRVGYMSSDYCAHPVSFLMAELIERHDRSHFEVYGYCCSPEDGSDTRRRITSAFDHFRSVKSLNEENTARLIREDRIDILVDLNGLTAGTRMFALRWRPAPVQITYLGYIGPIPLPELDYILCDEFVIPKSQAALFRPAPLYLPGLYQVNDSKLPVGPTPSRPAAGLPEDRFVFCCFSNNYKITEEIFEAWMTILERVENSVIWLLADNKWAHANMIARAKAHGVDPGRLIFTERVSPPDYLGRLALADLFLDTFPYNAGTTASDALRMGLPVLTLTGESFVSRMAGSLLRAIGLNWGISSSLTEYMDKAVEAATDPAKYRSIRNTVGGDAWRRTIGDTETFVPRLETLYRSIVKRPPV